MKRRLRILIIYKRSALCVSGELSARLGDVPRFKSNHLRHYETLKEIQNALDLLNLNYRMHARNSNIDYRGFDLIISVGGDGTVLEAARNMSNRQLLLGVNSDPDWSVGMFCHAQANNFVNIILRVLKGSARVHPLYKLRVVIKQVSGAVQCVECLNDILICPANPAAMSRYQISIGNRWEEHRDSGIWFSSAAGSTGAILSAGGKKLPLQSRAIQYKPRELYHAKDVKYCLKGGLVHQGQKVRILSEMPEGRVFVDGSHVRYPFTYGCSAVVSNSSNFVNLVYS